MTTGPLVSTLGPIDISDDTAIDVHPDETPPASAIAWLDDIPDPYGEPPAAPPAGDDATANNHRRNPDDDD
jgi:hypothetical protein